MGTSDGVGKELAKLYRSAGKRVIGLSRNQSPERIEYIPTNLRDDKSLDAAAQKINTDKESLEALINCAGVLSIEKADSLTTDEVNKILETNVRAPLLLTSRLMNKIKKDGADIVNVASTVGTKGYTDQAAYGASKWAVRGISANLQVELKNTPCRVISFCPGGIKTKLFEKATGVDSTSDGSWMSPNDVALLIKQLLDLPKNIEVSEIIVNRK